MSELMSYDDVLSRVCGRNPNLLLGNGFSIDLNNKFSYVSLFKSADFSDNPIMRQLFEYIGVSDFEMAMKYLDGTADINQIYGISQDFIKRLRKDSEYLRYKLIEVISNNLPDHIYNISPIQAKSCRAFLLEYATNGQVFSLNYDTLLYWATLHQECGDNCSYIGNDGFRGRSALIYTAPELSKINYLHGALHLYENNDVTYKLRPNGTLKNAIMDNISGRNYPIIVAEGDAIKKMDKIYSKNYLRICYDKFRFIKNDLVIFGFSFSNNDNHILDAITSNSYLTNMYVSLFADDVNQHFIVSKIVNMNKIRNNIGLAPININFYDSSSAQVWTKCLGELFNG